MPATGTGSSTVYRRLSPEAPPRKRQTFLSGLLSHYYREAGEGSLSGSGVFGKEALYIQAVL